MKGSTAPESARMAFKSAIATALRPAEEGPRQRVHVDLDHLHRQTMGDRQLQREVMSIFIRHSAEQIARMKTAESVEERREAAHALVGAAKGVGAFAVAAIAGENEKARGPVIGRLKSLERAAATARHFIEGFLAE